MNIFSQQENQSGVGSKRASSEEEVIDTQKRQKLTSKDNATAFYSMEKVQEKKIERFKATASYNNTKIKDLEVRDLPNIVKTLIF